MARMKYLRPLSGLSGPLPHQALHEDTSSTRVALTSDMGSSCPPGHPLPRGTLPHLLKRPDTSTLSYPQPAEWGHKYTSHNFVVATFFKK